MTKDEALKLALEFIENSECGTADLEAHIKEALAQTQEPVVCPACKAEVLYECVACSSNNYPPKRTWVGLTDEEVIVISNYALTCTMAVQMTAATLKGKNSD